ncbi:hypothetical protein COOONC_13272 [Cooperia oncophora]
MGMMIVDQGYDRTPELRRDPFWDSVHPLYSEETSRIPNNVPQGSVSHVKLASSVSEVVMMPHSRAETGNTPVFSTGASIRKSKNVKVKDDERYKPRQREESMIFRSVRIALNKIYNSISSFFASLIPARKHKEEKPPITVLSVSQLKPSVDELNLYTNFTPVSVAIPTEAPLFNEKYVE